MNNIEDLLQLLLKNDFEFVLIGGFAALVHGSSQVTQDLDICASLSSEQMLKLRQILKDLHPQHRMMPQKLSFLNFPENVEGLKNLYIETDWGILDILSQVSGIGPFSTVRERAIEVEIEGQKCRVISLDDLITAKLEIGRPKDKFTASELLYIKNSGKTLK